MSSPQKAKGTRWESAVTDFLRAAGLRAYKPRQEGLDDVGDIHAGPAVVQAKDWRSWESAIREGLDGAVRQAAAWDARLRGAGAPSMPVAVVKRARRPVGDSYAVLRLSDLALLLRAAEAAALPVVGRPAGIAVCGGCGGAAWRDAGGGMVCTECGPL